MYIHEQPDWPNLHWGQAELADRLAAVRHRQGRLFGRMEALGFDLRQEAALGTLTSDVDATSAIEGELLDVSQVRSSVARRLGMDIAGLRQSSRQVDGIVDLTMDAMERYDEPLTEQRLFKWHTLLFPTGRGLFGRFIVGEWRDGPMEVLSGAIGRERVHFEAPSADRLESEMGTFLEWFNAPADIDGVLKAALAHFWFVTIHPFDDGNGRIARAIADMALVRSEDSPRRFYSMSSQIRKERRAYYNILERTQKGATDVSTWMEWFVDCLGRAIDGADDTLSMVLAKARFWEDMAGVPFNPRQHKVLNRLLDGFDGKLTSSRWASMTHSSPDTALRDIAGLIEWGVLERSKAGGRSTSYTLARPPGGGGASSPQPSASEA